MSAGPRRIWSCHLRAQIPRETSNSLTNASRAWYYPLWVSAVWLPLGPLRSVCCLTATRPAAECLLQLITWNALGSGGGRRRNPWAQVTTLRSRVNAEKLNRVGGKERGCDREKNNSVRRYCTHFLLWLTLNAYPWVQNRMLLGSSLLVAEYWTANKNGIWRKQSSGMWHRVEVVLTSVI
jgi:hypothetical protein